MDFYGCYFQYAGKPSYDYGLRIVNVTTQENKSMSGRTESMSVFNKRTRTRTYIGSDYQDSPIQFDIEIVSDIPIERKNERAIQKWLFNRSGYKKLYIRGEDYAELHNDEAKELFLNCRFINPQKLEYNGGLVGYKCTMECDSYLAWQDPITNRFTFENTTTNSSQNIQVEIDTDMEGYTYPKVTITMGSSGGNISIVNHTDDSGRITSFENLTPNANIVVNGMYNYVSGNYYEKFVNRNFIRMLDGKNSFTLSGDISAITFEWSNRRYI